MKSALPQETLSAAWDAQLKELGELEAWKIVGSATLLGAPASYWQDWKTRDGVAMAKKLRGPILIVRGERDYRSWMGTSPPGARA
jgi:hypothetical protein